MFDRSCLSRYLSLVLWVFEVGRQLFGHPVVLEAGASSASLAVSEAQVPV